MKRSTTEAKASLSSNRSMSLAVMPARSSTFSVTSAGPVSMMQGSEPMEPKARMRARGFRPCAAPGFLRAQQHRGGAIDDAGGIAGMVDVIDLFDLRITLLRHRIEAGEIAQLFERRLERTQRLHGRIGAHVLVAIEDGLAENVLHRDHGIREIALVPGIGRALLAFDGEGVDIVAGETVHRRDQIGADALRREIGLVGDGRDRSTRRRRRRPCRRGSSLSTPPPIVMSDWPDMIWPAAMLVASRPEAQKRLICTPATLSA